VHVSPLAPSQSSFAIKTFSSQARVYI